MKAHRIRPLVAACAAAVGATIALAGPAIAGEAVDPGTLNPAPPPSFNPQCSLGGAWIICHTTVGGETFSEVIDFGLPCGTVYSTGVDVRHGIRWYDSETRTLVKRSVTQDAEFTFSLSPDGSGPTVKATIHANWRNPDIVDGDVGNSSQYYHGSETWSAPGYGVIVHVAGFQEPADGPHHGLVRFIDDPAVAAELCSALGA